MEKVKNVVQMLAFILLVGLVSMPVWSMLVEYGYMTISSSGTSHITNHIYVYNGILCILSLILQVFFVCAWGFQKYKENHARKDVKIKKQSYHEICQQTSIKKHLWKQCWPCILLILFMLWTAVGCIQAGMEAKAEAEIKKGNITEENIKIALWTSGDRMENAADRSWNGCNNLKDGYFSFLFYASIVGNVVLLGIDNKNKKLFILRILLLSMFVVVLLSFLKLLNSAFVGSWFTWQRAFFHNSNHYGYFLCIITMLSFALFLYDTNWYFKSISFLVYALSLFMLIINNTSGAYLGVLVGVVFVFLFQVIEIIKGILIKRKRKWAINSTDSKKIENFSKDMSLVKKASEKNGIRKFLPEILSLMKLLVGVVLFIIYSCSIVQVSNKGTLASFQFQMNGEKDTIVAENLKQHAKDIKTLLKFLKGEDEADKANKQTETKGENDKTDKNEGQQPKLDNEVANIGSGRGEVWIRSLDLMEQRPIFGWGLENLLNEFYYQYNVNEGRTHNLILQLGGTTGIIGMLLYMTAIIAIFFKNFLRFEMREKSAEMRFVQGIALVFIAIFMDILAKNMIMDKLFVRIVFVTIVLWIVWLAFSIKKVHSRVKEWSMIEKVTIPIFIAYMVSSMFGNSAFYTSPYFMVILGMMVATVLYDGRERDPHKEDSTK